MANFCTNCGAPLDEGMNVCLSCGSTVEETIEEIFGEVTEETTEATTEETAGATTENTSTEMKYCGKCGKAISKDAVVCVHCGCAVDGASTGEQDSDNIGWGFLGFFVPIAGFILWLMWKDKMPKKAKKLGIGALISVCLSAAGSIFSFIPALFL